MGKLRNLIIIEIRKFIKNENELKGDEWNDNLFAPTDKVALHVSEIDYVILNNSDILRFLMYLLLERDRAIDYRLTHSHVKDNDVRFKECYEVEMKFNGDGISQRTET